MADETTTTDATPTPAPAPAAAPDATVRDLPEQKIRTADSDDPGIGWTNQHGFQLPENEAVPGQTVTAKELPTEEGLKEIGVQDTETYLANVSVEG